MFSQTPARVCPLRRVDLVQSSLMGTIFPSEQSRKETRFEFGVDGNSEITVLKK